MKLSVIVCTYNRSAAIIDCLRSIEATIVAAAPVEAEIVIVNNNSTDNTGAVVAQWATNSTVPVKLVTEPLQGLANARNCGLRTATGALIAFTDDDCRMHVNYVKDLLRHDRETTEDVFRGGRVELGDPTDLPLTIKIVDVKERVLKADNGARRQNLANYVVGANMMARRRVFDRIGPFDWRFSTAEVNAGEDADYIFRAYLASIPVEYVPDMAVTHFHGRKTGADGYKLFRSYMIGSGALYAKHVLNDYNLCRQFVWDLKGAVKEVLTGRNLFWPDIGFSNRDKMRFYMKGIVNFLAVTLNRHHPRRPTKD